MSNILDQTNGHKKLLDPRLQYGNINYTTNSPYMLPASYPVSEFVYGAPPCAPIDSKTDDELFVETWLSKIGKINLNLESTVVQVDSSSTKALKAEKRKRPMSLSHARESLKKCLEVTSRLEATEKILKENASTMSTEEWKKHTIGIGSLKDELTLSMAQFANPDVIKDLKFAIKARNKKRNTQRNKRTAMKLEKQEEQKHTFELHKKIDNWLLLKKEEAQKARMEETKKKDADVVLSEVTRKKAEAKKQLSLINALIKLRNVRETAAKARGEKSLPEDNALFVKTVETLVNMWENALRNYEQEENNLKLMLKQSAEEDVKLDEENKKKAVGDQWDLVLFGPKEGLTPLYWALTAAEQDFDKFVAIRKSWDTFLDPKGTKIPLGWVMPNDNPNLEWKRYQSFNS